MGKLETLRTDGTLHGVVTELNGMLARGEISKLIAIVVPANEKDVPKIAFCRTDNIVEEFGLCEAAKLHAVTTRKE